MTSKRSASKAKVDDATAGEAEVHGWKSSKCTDSHLLDLVGKHLLQPRSVIHWCGSRRETFPHEDGNEYVVFLMFFGASVFLFPISFGGFFITGGSSPSLDP